MNRVLLIIFLLLNFLYSNDILKKENNITIEYIIYLKESKDINFPKSEEFNLSNIEIQKIDNFKKDYPMLSDKELKYFSRGFGGNYSRLHRVNSAYKITFNFNQKYNFTLHKKFDEYIYKMGKNMDGYIYDIESREIFTPKYWNILRIKEGWESRGIIPIRHIAKHFYKEDNGKYRIVTLGMKKFGLPELSIDDVYNYKADDINKIINVVIYKAIYDDINNTMILNLKDLPQDSYISMLIKNATKDAKLKTRLYLKATKPKEGDANNRAATILFTKNKKEGTYKAQYRAIEELFGIEDLIFNTDRYNNELKKASIKSRKKLPYLKEKFNKGLDAGETILLKAPFKYGKNRREWMWVEVKKWVDKNITAILSNKPYYVKRVHEGDVVHVNEDDIFDYIYYKKDGTTLGNETSKIIQKYEKIN